MKTIESGPDLGIAEPIILEHFGNGLEPESAVFLDSSSERSSAHLTLLACKDILGKIIENTPYVGFLTNFQTKKKNPCRPLF
jgi:hypothetical protein